MNAENEFAAELEGLNIEQIMEKLCAQKLHQLCIGHLTAAFFYSDKNQLLDLLQSALLIRHCSACCDLLLSFSNGVYEDEESYYKIDDDDDGLDPVIECMFPQLIDLVMPNRNWTLCEGENIMLLAIRLNQIEVVKMLLDKWPDLINCTTIYGQSLLIHSIMCRSFDIVRYFFETAEFKTSESYDYTALTVACFTKGCPLDIVATLIEVLEQKKGFIPKSSLQEPLFYAAKRRRLDIVEMILAKDGTLINEPLNGKEWTLIHCILAHEFNRNEMLENIFNKISINNLNLLAQTSEGDTILHMAITHEVNFAWIKKFLEHGPELAHIQNKAGSTPLIEATRYHNFEVAELLIREFNVDVNVQDVEGRSAIEVAAWNDSVEIAKWLLEFGGADVHIKNKNGNNVFTELFQYLRYGVNDDDAKIEILCLLMPYTYNESNVNETFQEIFSRFHKTIERFPRFEVLQSWLYSCYFVNNNPYEQIAREFTEEYQLEAYPERNVIALCLHKLVESFKVEIAVNIKVAEQLSICAEDAVYEGRNIDTLIKVAEILKKVDVISCGIGMKQSLFFPRLPPDMTIEELRPRLKRFYEAFNRLGFINMDKAVKFCISEILFSTQYTFEEKVFQLRSGILQTQMKLMVEEPTPSTISDIELARHFLTKEDVMESIEFKMVKSFLSPKYINIITMGKEMLPIESLCRSAFRNGLFEACKSRSNGDITSAKLRFYEIMETLQIPLKLKNYLSYQY
uniref:CSON012452 protein n=1 Tax=Culicoides sonorensis TaxID=179676 RepID=A0A336M845_CULSO